MDHRQGSRQPPVPVSHATLPTRALEGTASLLDTPTPNALRDPDDSHASPPSSSAVPALQRFRSLAVDGRCPRASEQCPRPRS
eukprot:6181016-Pleurochrysis_carterae.AAC.1